VDVPCKTGVEAELWATGVSTTTMSAAELAAYEEKKLKMRKAMGENLGDAVPGETRDAAQRRCRLIRYQDVPTALCQKRPPYKPGRRGAGRDARRRASQVP